MRSRPRRVLPPIVPASIALLVALTLAAGPAGLVVARSADPVGVAAPAAASPAAATNRVGSDRAGVDDAARADASRGTADASSDVLPPPPKPTAAPEPRPTVQRTKPAPHVPARPAFRGRNHVWIPALGINASIQTFACSRSSPPQAGVYRWGCAGRNNVYLLAHAWSTFKPLHDAYLAGRLRAGMRVTYADAGGHVRTYRVAWWRVVLPTNAAWAWAAQARPSMTLQTCVGAASQYRLVVRLSLAG